MGRKAKGLLRTKTAGCLGTALFAQNRFREAAMARIVAKKFVLLFLCAAVFVLSILAGTVLSALLIKAPEL
jgi:hypothetical protein